MNTRIGAVIYDPRVTVIWDIIGRFFKERGEPLSCVNMTVRTPSDRSARRHSRNVASIRFS